VRADLLDDRLLKDGGDGLQLAAAVRAVVGFTISASGGLLPLGSVGGMPASSAGLAANYSPRGGLHPPR